MTQALAKGARDKGAEIARFTEVTEIDRSPSGEWTIHTSKGKVQCEIIINATGFYGAKIGEVAKALVPVTALEHQYLITEPLEELESDKNLFPLIRDPEIRFYLRRERSSFYSVLMHTMGMSRGLRDHHLNLHTNYFPIIWMILATFWRKQ